MWHGLHPKSLKTVGADTLLRWRYEQKTKDFDFGRHGHVGPLIASLSCRVSGI